MKVCTKCGEKKALTEFYRNTRSNDGRMTICIVCDKIRRKRYYIEHREHEIERSTLHAKNTKYEAAKRWRATHRQGYNAYMVAYRARRKQNNGGK